MTWQTAIIVQIIFSSFVTLFTRRATVRYENVHLLMGVINYLVIALLGIVCSVLVLGTLPALPSGEVWIYLILEGVFIPAAWLITYKVIAHVGASNGVILSAASYISACLAAVFFLSDAITGHFMVGAAMIVGSIFLAARIKPDRQHVSGASGVYKVGLALVASLFFAGGMLFEKKALNVIGVWDYVFYGWGMQLVSAVALFWVFGRRQLAKASMDTLRTGLALGGVTCVTGLLYVYALNKGRLSHTLIAASGKMAVVTLLAAVFMGERNNMPTRLVAFVLSLGGIALIVG